MAQEIFKKVNNELDKEETVKEKLNKLDEAAWRFERGLPLTAIQAAYILNLSTSTVRNLIATGQLQAVRLSNRRLAINPRAVQAHIENGVTT